MHPAGTFEAEVLDHGLTESKNGNPQVAVKFQTDQGAITAWFVLTDKAAEYTVEKVRNMGFAGDSLEQLNDGQCLVGNPCQIVVQHKTYNGQQRAKVAFVNPAGYEGGSIDRSDGAAANARKFNALLRKKPGAAPARRDDGPLASTDDDIPF